MPNQPQNNNKALKIILIIGFIISCILIACIVTALFAGGAGVKVAQKNARDIARTVDIRTVNVYLLDYYRYFGIYPKSLTIDQMNGSTRVYATDIYIEPMFRSDPIIIDQKGLNKVVTHGNCGTATESSWNLVYEVSSDQKSYDLSACLESGEESTNLSTTQIHKY